MRILLASVSAGSGHVRAAEAVQSAIKRYFPDTDTKHVDIMDFVPPFFRQFYVGGYTLAANKLPSIWGLLFYSTDKQNMPGQTLTNFLQFRLCGRFVKLIEEYKPDLILTTHFLLPQILPFLIKKGIKTPVHCVVTDFYAHQFWLDKNIPRYYVAQEKSTEKLVAQGIERTRIVVSGIPIHQNFNETVNKGKIVADLKFESGVPTLLFLSGGLGFGDLAATVKSIFALKNKIQIITVSGKNAKLHAKLQGLKAPEHVRAVHLGFVTNMHELLSVSDIVVTKAGGLTVSECLAKGNAMILYPVIPGQEEKNCEFLESVGAGIIAKSLADVSATIKKLLEDPGKVAQMRNNSFLYAKPAAALTVAQNSGAAKLPL